MKGQRIPHLTRLLSAVFRAARSSWWKPRNSQLLVPRSQAAPARHLLALGLVAVLAL